jgi:signal transduction histidine kinase/ActR/RegA family two-component response regulator
MQKVSLFSRLLILALTSLPVFSCGNGSSQKQNPPRAVKGILDLSNWDFERDGLVALSGEHEFYWQQHLFSESFVQPHPPEKSGFINVPDVWNGYEWHGMNLPGEGYATYRLTILFREPPPSKLAFKFLDMGTAYTVFANGEKILSVGNAGAIPEATVPRYFPQVVDFVPDSSHLELIYQVSNFHHRRGGAWEVIRLGTSGQIYKMRERRLALDLILFGSILVMGLYHLVLFRLRKKDLTSFYFGLFCVLIAIRLLTTVERFLLHIFPEMSWELFVKIEYLSVYLSVPVFALFLYLLFPQGVHRSVVALIVVLSGVFAIIVCATKAVIFSHTILPHQVFIFFSMAYALSALGVCTIRKQEGAIIVLIGFLFLFAAVVNDILDANGLIQTGHFVHFGLFVFIFSQAFLLSARYAKAFTTIEWQREDLEAANLKYKNELIERMRAEKENQDLQERLARSQKMEAIGLLAGGVAHDLNNILSGIVNYPELLLLDLPEKSPMIEPLQAVRDAGLRAASVVQDLLTLARRGVMQFKPVNLNDIVTDYLSSAEHTKLKLDHPSIKVATNLESNLFNIMGSSQHLKKTVENLVANAAEAQSRGGIITVSTANLYVDRPINGYENVKEGNYVVFKVEDRGIGITPDDLKKIFEPFYTKKAMGRNGTGLGLSVVWGIVHDHRGYINVETTAGQGATFELYFQVTQEECTKEKSLASIEEYMGRNEFILVVDDVAEQREIASRILKRLGYTVITAAGGEEAVEYLKTHTADLVILDMIMDPGIDGLETYKRIIETRPQMKAIIASGFAETDRVGEAQKLGAGSYVRKPYTLEKIGMAVRAELEKSTKVLKGDRRSSAHLTTPSA